MHHHCTAPLYSVLSVAWDNIEIGFKEHNANIRTIKIQRIVFLQGTKLLLNSTSGSVADVACNRNA